MKQELPDGTILIYSVDGILISGWEPKIRECGDDVVTCSDRTCPVCATCPAWMDKDVGTNAPEAIAHFYDELVSGDEDMEDYALVNLHEPIDIGMCVFCKHFVEDYFVDTKLKSYCDKKPRVPKNYRKKPKKIFRVVNCDMFELDPDTILANMQREMSSFVERYEKEHQKFVWSLILLDQGDDMDAVERMYKNYRSKSVGYRVSSLEFEDGPESVRAAIDGYMQEIQFYLRMYGSDIALLKRIYYTYQSDPRPENEELLYKRTTSAYKLSDLTAPPPPPPEEVESEVLSNGADA